MDSDQRQKAVANSNQYQVKGDLVINHGITEDRAKEISRETFDDLYRHYSQESYETALGRVEQLEERVIRQLGSDGQLDVLADPAFQSTFRRAQLTAAATERGSDYEILSDLLADRANRSDIKRIRASINRAVEVVDQIEDDALTAVTITMLIHEMRPTSGLVQLGIDSVERVLGQVLESNELPSDSTWIDDLDILDVVRIDHVQHFHKFDQFWPNRTPGYISAGLPFPSEEAYNVDRELARLNIPPILTLSDLKERRVRVAFPAMDIMKDHLLKSGAPPEVVEEVVRIARESCNFEVVDEEAKEAYIRKVRELPYHSRIASWWDALPTAFAITGVGRVLSRANAKRLDRLGALPILD